jgi:hypothetical protein
MAAAKKEKNPMQFGVHYLGVKVGLGLGPALSRTIRGAERG